MIATWNTCTTSTSSTAVAATDLTEANLAEAIRDIRYSHDHSHGGYLAQGWIDINSGTYCTNYVTQDYRYSGDIDIQLNIRSQRVDEFFGERLDFLTTARLTNKTPYEYQEEKKYKFGASVMASIEMLDSQSSKGILMQLINNVGQELSRAAKETGKQIAKDIVAGKFKVKEIDPLDRRALFEEMLREFKIEIPVDDEKVKVPLIDIIKPKIEGCSREFDYGEIRNITKKYKKEFYIKKLKSINIRKQITSAHIKLEDAYAFWGVKGAKDFKNYSEKEIQKELRALTLLRKMIQDSEFTKYMKEKYIDVQDIVDKSRTYRVYRDKRVEVLINEKVDSSLCIHLSNGSGPRTDEVIAKLLLAKTNGRELINRSNVYK